MNLRHRLTQEEWSVVKRHREPEGVLVIGDLHHPFTKKGYLEFCIGIRNKYNTKRTMFIGDILDNHFAGYHEIDPDGHSAGRELELAKASIQEWYREFPVADVCIGNHDAIPNRKAMTAGLSVGWIKPISEVINTPGWNFQIEHIIDEVLYTHGTGRKARQRAKNDLISVVQGHYHSESYIENFCGQFYRIFALQVGCGIDNEAYAMAYGKNFGKMHRNCAVIKDHGTLPIIESMHL